MHYSPIYNECQSQSAWVLALPWERAYEDDSNDTPPHNPNVNFKVASLYRGLRLILVYPVILSKGKLIWNLHICCGVSFEPSWWPCFCGSANTYVDWVWHSLEIGAYAWCCLYFGLLGVIDSTFFLWNLFFNLISLESSLWQSFL